MFDRGRTRAAADGLLLAAFPAALLVVFALPLSVRRSFVLSYTDPTLVTAYTAHFIHLETVHLLTNIGAYLLVAPLTYLLVRVQGSEIRFRVILIAMLVGLPFALSGLNIVFVRPRVGYGASGVVSGMFGLLSLELFEYVRAALRPRVSQRWAAILFFVNVTLISVVLFPQVDDAWLGLAVGGIATTVYTLGFARELATADQLWLAWISRAGYAELAVCAGTLVTAFPVLAFSLGSGGDRTVLNLYTHFLGFSIMFIAGYILPNIDGAEQPSTVATQEISSGSP